MSAIARLSFEVAAQHLDRFAAGYAKNLAPILRQHGLAEPNRQPTAVAGTFNSYFAIETPATLQVAGRALAQDPHWQAARRQAAADLSPTTTSPLPYHLGLYRAAAGPGTPFKAMVEAHKAGPGRRIKAGLGSRRGIWHNLDSSDGFPSGGVLCLLQDRQGHMWFGLWGMAGMGLCRYDGTEFLSFSMADGLPATTVYALCEDRAGHLWMGTDAGLCRYDGTDFVTFRLGDRAADNIVRALCRDRDGNLWCGTGPLEAAAGHWEKPGGGLWRYDGTHFTRLTSADGLPSDTIRTLCQDGAGNLWLGSGRWDHSGAGVCRYDGDQFSTFTRPDGLADNVVRTAVLDQQGHLWLGTRAGLSRWDGDRFETYGVEAGLIHPSVWSSCADQQGGLWFGTRHGVSRYDGKTFANFTTAEGLIGNQVGALTADREGSLWFGSGHIEAVGNGISRYEGLHLTAFTVKDGLVSDHITCILEDGQGHLWFGTWEGVNWWDGEGFHSLEGLQDNVRALALDRQGRLWMGTTTAGLICYDGAELTRFSTADGLASNQVEALLVDSDGHLWIGTVDGLSRYAAGVFTNFTTADGLAHNAVWTIGQDRRGHLWFGSLHSATVSRYDGQRFSDATATEGSASMLRSRSTGVQGRVWFRNGRQLRSYDGDTSKPYTIARDKTGGAPIISLLEDRQGHLWLATYGGGVIRYDGLAVQMLHQRNGLVHNGVQQVLEDRSGDFWIATEGGLTRYQPTGQPPQVRLLRAVADREYAPVGPIELPSTQKRLAIHFDGLSFKSSPDQMVYVYRLDPCDADWRTTRDPEAIYTELGEGEYTFAVRAVDRDLLYSTVASLALTIKPDPHLEALTQALSQSGVAGEFVGASPALHQVQQQLAQVAVTNLTVLILGETGTGKGLAARTVHGLSACKNGPFIQINCGAIPPGLVESELFGHEKGAFTGATARRLGKVELAAGGTLFLDEIGDMTLEAQTRLLRLLEERQFERVGGTQTLPVEVRVIAATNRDLEQMVAAGRFREDLYFRLQVFPVKLPPLRQRRQDIALLATYFMEHMATHLNKAISHLTPQALELLQAYAWPGNVRELEHVIQRAVVICTQGQIAGKDLGLETSAKALPATTEFVTLEEMERRYIRQVLHKTGGVIKGPDGAAVLLGLPASTLYFRMKKLGISRKA